MSEVRNVLYVTTRQWNPGDEFILAGVKNILRELGWRPQVEAIFNKSPQVVAKLSRFNPFKLKSANLSAGYLDAFVQTAHFDNSFGASNDINLFDAVVFCGSPGWFGGRLRALYDQLCDFRGQVLYLGIGSSNRGLKLTDREVQTLKSAAFLSVRDERLAAELKSRYEVASEWITCPALLAAPFAVDPATSTKIGCVYTSAQTNRGHRVSDAHEALQNGIFHEVISQHPETEIVCNYYDEVDRAAALFGRDRVRYTYEALDYATLMGEYRYVVSSRVHGCGLSSSVGVPNLLLGHDRRAATVRGFGSFVTTDPDEVLACVRRFGDADAIRTESTRLQSLKQDLLKTYASSLQEVSARPDGALVSDA